jgi:hypothetical protein
MTLKEMLILLALAGALGWFLLAVYRNAMRGSAMNSGRRIAVFAGGLLGLALLIWLSVALGVSPRVFQPRF